MEVLPSSLASAAYMSVRVSFLKKKEISRKCKVTERPNVLTGCIRHVFATGKGEILKQAIAKISSKILQVCISFVVQGLLAGSEQKGNSENQLCFP